MSLLTYATTGNKIGSFGFVSLTNKTEGNGPPEQLTSRSVSLTRPGVDGVGVRRQGINPTPFVMESGLDVTSFAEARTLLASYDAASKIEPLKMWYGGVYWGRFAVLSVKLVSLVAVSGGAGGFRGTNGKAFLTVQWELVPVED